MDQEDQFEQMMQALDSVKRSKPDKVFIDRLTDRAQARILRAQRYSRPVIMGIAAALIALVVLNFFMLTTEISSSETMVYSSDYNLIPVQNIYYE